MRLKGDDLISFLQKTLSSYSQEKTRPIRQIRVVLAQAKTPRLIIHPPIQLLVTFPDLIRLEGQTKSYEKHNPLP